MFLLQWAEFVLFAGLLFAVCILFSIMGYFYVSVELEDLKEKEEKGEMEMPSNMINLVAKKAKI